MGNIPAIRLRVQLNVWRATIRFAEGNINERQTGEIQNFNACGGPAPSSSTPHIAIDRSGANTDTGKCDRLLF